MCRPAIPLHICHQNNRRLGITCRQIVNVTAAFLMETSKWTRWKTWNYSIVIYTVNDLGICYNEPIRLAAKSQSSPHNHESKVKWINPEPCLINLKITGGKARDFLFREFSYGSNEQPKADSQYNASCFAINDVPINKLYF